VVDDRLGRFELMIDWVVSIMISMRSESFANPSFDSRFWRIVAQVETCVGVVTLGKVTMKLAGSLLPVCSARRERKMSSVRIARTLHSSENVLMRIPMNGERMLSRMPLATSSAAAMACPSSSSSGRLP